jgi:hypothetical protein
LRLPRGGGLARPQANHDVLEADRLARAQRQVADDAVALVEQTQDRDPLRHRRHAGLVGGRARHLDGDGIAFGRLVLAAVAAGERGNGGQVAGSALHVWSGVQAL